MCGEGISQSHFARTVAAGVAAHTASSTPCSVTLDSASSAAANPTSSSLSQQEPEPEVVGKSRFYAVGIRMELYVAQSVWERLDRSIQDELYSVCMPINNTTYGLADTLVTAISPLKCRFLPFLGTSL